MKRHNVISIRYRSEFDAPVEALWSFHLEADALDRLSPPLAGFRVVRRGNGVEDGSILEAEIGAWPFRQRWVALHSGVEESRSFTDVALESPFRYWVHVHSFEDLGGGRSRLTDSIWFVPPRWMGQTVGRVLIKPLLRLMFRWRHRVTRRMLDRGHPRRGRARGVEMACAFLSLGGSI